jgi:hypothetical protein
MHALAILLLTAAVSTSHPILTTTLVLRNGTHFEVDGPIREEQQRIIFRTSGSLYSIPINDVDMEATRAAVSKPVVATSDSDKKQLKVSASERDRLLRELEQNHSGTPRADTRTESVSEPRESPDNGNEWSWRAAARAHEEAVRRAKEDLELLRSRAEVLRQQIRQFFGLGYKPNQFSYQASELETTLAQIPASELEVTRAQRANDQFREDARKQGILPGWLR